MTLPAKTATNADLREALEGVLWQVGCRTSTKGAAYLSSCSLSALEYGFEVLGWPDPMRVPVENACDVVGCFEWPGDQGPWDGLYVCICSKHSAEKRTGKPRPKVRRHRLQFEATRCPKCHVAGYKKGRKITEHHCLAGGHE